MKHRLSPFALALLVSLPADALLLLQGDVQFELDPAMLRIAADAAFRPLHQALWDKALTDFRWLDRDGWVQQTTFSDGSRLTANFSAQPFADAAAHSLRATLADGRTFNVAP